MKINLSYTASTTTLLVNCMIIEIAHKMHYTCIDNVYRTAMWANACISFIYHGTMVRSKPSTWSPLHNSNICFTCSIVDSQRYYCQLLQTIDQSCVCFMCLYCIFPQTSIYVIIGTGAVSCISAALGGMTLVMPIVAVCIFYFNSIVDEQDDMILSMFFRLSAALCIASFLYMYRIGSWCTPFRWLWHVNCSIVILCSIILKHRMCLLYTPTK